MCHLKADASLLWWPLTCYKWYRLSQTVASTYLLPLVHGGWKVFPWNVCQSNISLTAVETNFRQHQGRIQPVRLGGGTISVIFAGPVPLWVHYCERDEVYFTTLLWQNYGLWWIKLLSQVLGRRSSPMVNICFVQRSFSPLSRWKQLTWYG